MYYHVKSGGRKEMTVIRNITPLLFENYLIITLSKDWINKLSDIPKFSVKINNTGKLCITSESSIKKERMN